MATGPAAPRRSEELLPLLHASAPSAVVNVASTAGRASRARTGAYSASKWARSFASSPRAWSAECSPAAPLPA